MAEYSASASLVTPSGTIVFNAAATPKFLHDPTVCSGLDQAPIRATIDDKPVSDGGIWHRHFLGAREITLGGVMIVDAPADWNVLEAQLIAALDSIREDPSVTGTYRWTPSGLTLHSVVVRCDVAATFSYSTSDHLRHYQFGLVAIDPTVTIA